jgi:putative DNA methylase
LKHAVIEDASIELLELFDKVSQHAKKEKAGKIPLTRGIFWWTRKPIVVGRAVILASTLNDIKDVESILGTLNLKDKNYLHIPNNLTYADKLSQSPNEIKILDPFAGAGSLVFPSVQLGLDVTSSDYNPLAHIIEKSVLEYPVKYNQNLVADFEKYANQVILKTKEELGQFFNEKHLSYLWCWCITCPYCKQRFPLTNQMYIVKSKNDNIGIKINPKDKDFTIEIVSNIADFEGKKYTQKGGKALCINCKNSIDYKTVVGDISKNKDREMIVIQIQTTNGRKYIIPTSKEKQTYQNAVIYFNSKKEIFDKEGSLPTENIHAAHRKENSLWYYGITQWNDYFDGRQLLVLISFSKNIKKVCNQIDDNEYSKVIALYLAAILAKRVDMSGFGVHWNKVAQKPENILSMRRPAFAFNYVETNPFEKIGGSFSNILKSISNFISFCVRLEYSSKCNLESVTQTSNTKYDIILTDPPYGDDVHYGELSEFFYVWVYRVLKDYFPELPPRVPLEEDFCESWGRFGDKKLAKGFFAKGLDKSFVSMNDKLKDDGLLVVFFAHSSTETWNIFLESIRNAKFRVVSSYSIHTEMTSNILSQGNTSFMSSIVVSCRKILQPSEAYFEDLTPQIEDKIKNMLKQIPGEKLLSIPITDLLIMVYGKVLEACTQHTILKSSEKDFNPNFETLIKDARSIIMKELVGKITGKSLNVIGPRMAFYLLIKVFHKGIIASDDAIKISKTYDVDIKDLEKDQVVIKDKDVIRLYYLNENEMDYSPDNVEKSNLYQQLCYLAYTADSRGLDKIPAILSNDNFRAEDLTQVISLLIKNYHLRRNKGESLIPKEQRELEILETLGDTVGVKVEGTMDSFL